MAGNFSKPVVTDAYATVLSEVRDLVADLAKMMDGTGTLNTPTGAIRWSASNIRFEKYNGTTWGMLSTGYDINVSGLQGYAPGNGQNNLAINNGVLNVNLNADQVDGKDASYFAAQAYVDSQFAGKAPLVSPVFSGSVIVPSPAWNDTSNQAASMLNVWTAVNWAMNNGIFPSGTRLLFHQDAAPTGWVKETNPYYNDRGLRIVTGNRVDGGAVPYSAIFSYRTTDGHVLTTQEMPSHAHTYTQDNFSGYGDVAIPGQLVLTSQTSANTGAVGGNLPHPHTIDMRVSFSDFIICQKA